MGSELWDSYIKHNNYIFLFAVFVMLLFFIMIINYIMTKRRYNIKTREELMKDNKFVSDNINRINVQVDINSNELKKMRNKAIWSIIILIICIVISIILSRNILIICAVSILSLLLLGKNITNYLIENENRYNETVKGVLYDYDKNLKYLPYKGFSEEEYKMCFFPEECDRFSSEDMIFNESNNFYYSDILIESEHEDRDNDTYYAVEFQGSLARIEILNVNCRIFLGSTRENYVFRSDGLTSIKFENEEFNKLFSACSDDEMQAYKILTPDVMEEFVNIKKYTYGDIDIRIIYDKLYIRFLSGDSFDSRLLNKKSEKKELLQSIAVLEEIMHTMEKVQKILNNKSNY